MWKPVYKLRKVYRWILLVVNPTGDGGVSVA